MKLFNFKKKKELINKKVLQCIIEKSNLCQHAIKELKLAGYDKDEDGPNAWMYQQVLETLAVFSSHDNSSISANFEINLVQKLCNFDVISPLLFTDDEWVQIHTNGTCQNIRKSNVFKESNGKIHYNGAFTIRPTGTYSFTTKQWTENKNPIYLNGGLFEHKDNVLTGAYFKICLLYKKDVEKGWMPKKPIIINCVEVEVSQHNCFMAVQSNEPTLYDLSHNYNICWRFCPCLKGVRLEDVTKELLLKAYKEINNQY